MAQSKCGLCGAGQFEAVSQAPSGSSFKVIFIQCSSCGAVLGTMDHFSVEATGQVTKKSIGDLARRITRLENLLTPRR